MISGLSAFAKVLGTGLVAEGIETRRQEATLKELGVDMGQGLYYSSPLRASEFLMFYESKRQPEPAL